MDHYNQFHSASYTAHVTGINRNTVNHYFNEFNETLVEFTNKEFINNQKRVWDQALCKADMILDDLEKQLIRIRKRIENANPDEIDIIKLEPLYLSINKFLYEAYGHKAAIEITPSLSISIQQIDQNVYSEEQEKTLEDQTKLLTQRI